LEEPDVDRFPALALAPPGGRKSAAQARRL